MRRLLPDRDARLPIWFALVSAVLIGALFLVTAAELRDSFEERAGEGLEQYASTVAMGLVAPLLTLEELTSGEPLAPDRRAEVLRVLDAAVATQPMGGIAVLGADGAAVLTSNAPVFDVPRDARSVDAALRGAARSSRTAADGPSGVGDQLRVLVPMRSQVDGAVDVVGAVEVVVPFGQTRSVIEGDVRELAVVLGVGLVLLWLALFNLVRTSARRLRDQHGRNRWLARHDALTELPNRVAFEERVEAGLDEGAPASVMVIDLDRFKDVNDTLGHHAGDELLRHVADRLRDVVGPHDMVARLGGDEFALVVPGDDAAAATDLAHRVVAALARPVTVGDVAFEVDASIGLALTPAHGTDFDVLLRRADVAMYAAKEGATAVRSYEDGMDPDTATRLLLVSALRRALEDGTVEVHLQPKVDVRSGRVTGLEALARWQDPSHGHVAPDVFVPLAEQAGLVGSLTRLVLRKGLDALVVLREDRPDLRLAVNISARDLLDAQLVPDVLAALAERHLGADALELEITETSAMRDPRRSLLALRALRDAGIGVAIDDYGTGYSSLSYLRSLPVSVLKIDRSFMGALGASGPDEAIVRSTIALGRSLGLSVVAEGVEDDQGVALLRDAGCHEAQGYRLSRPVPVGRAVAAMHEAETRMRASLAVGHRTAVLVAHD